MITDKKGRFIGVFGLFVEIMSIITHTNVMLMFLIMAINAANNVLDSPCHFEVYKREFASLKSQLLRSFIISDKDVERVHFGINRMP